MACLLSIPLFGASPRPITLDDLARLHEVESPQVSPDGKWVAYTVSSVDKEKDKKITHIWMAAWDGSGELQLTNGPESESSPQWSPDGRYLTFVSSRPGPAKGSQIWIMDRRGGEARQLTQFKDFTITEYEWAPDSKRLALILRQKDEPDSDDTKSSTPQPPKPVVIDRYHFKQDVEGYLTDKRNHIYLFEIATERLEPVTSGNFDDTNISWSPDGTRIAFISNRDPDPDRTENTDVFVVDAKANATPRKLTSFPGPDSGHPAWSPDGHWIAYLQGSEPKYSAYNMDRLALVPASGGAPRILTANFDRGVSEPLFHEDGESITVLAADDRSEYPARVSLDGAAVSRLVAEPSVASALSSKRQHTAVLLSTDRKPSEIYALENGALRQLSHQNDALCSELQLASTEERTFKSPDGTEVHSLLTKPSDFRTDEKYPLLLRIHGGPNGEDAHDFSFERQFFAANGYLVLNVNYRGSSGRGHAYTEAIFADWGHKEVMDLLAGVDDVVKMGVADPERLGIGGWSYGGILTDYSITNDHRFKAAISGAGSANQITMYGADQYVFQYDTEVGPPWKREELWVKLSYPFFHADRIRTPTLFMGGDKDFNVPLIGSEQMYQALKTLNVPTELVIYPGEFHEFTRPSFIRDRYQRYLDWYAKYLRK
jgi:dipeptidyl aminopeptidase/acylaminoacyl peptidase